MNGWQSSAVIWEVTHRMEGIGPRGGKPVLDSPMSDRAARAVVAVTPEEAPRAVETLTCAFSNDPSLER
jgi:hypothetical protein